MSHPRKGIKNLPFICHQLGMRYVVITPGSRNAPLIISFNQEKNLQCLSITDERSAGYFAIGLAQATGQPTGLVCTSGTAAMNFGPAIAEAFYQNIPLIVFTADRPPELIDQADGQTIRQFNVFTNHVKKSINLPVESSTDTDLIYINRLISEAVGIAMQFPRGPVHINVPLREPLYHNLPETSENKTIIRNATITPALTESELTKLSTKWNHFKKKMVVAGFGQPDEVFQELLPEIAKDPSVIIIAENLSNLYDDRFVFSPERFFAATGEIEKSIFAPELLVTIGNSIVSKRLKQFLRANKPTEHWHIAPWIGYTDTYQSLSLNIPVHPAYFFKKLLSSDSPSVITKMNYSDLYAVKEKELLKKHNQYLADAPFSDLKAFEQILASLPAESILQLANSTPVRYSQLFKTRPDIHYYSNRGTSGIDGCVSTAAGFAHASDKPVVIISGDLAFIYDSNALWNNNLSEQLRIIVMNNGGGNIFTLIETGSEMEPYDDFFVTPHKVDIHNLTAAFGIKHYFCDNSEGLKNQLDLFFGSPGPSVLEVKTDSKTDTVTFRNYFNAIKKLDKN